MTSSVRLPIKPIIGCVVALLGLTGLAWLLTSIPSSGTDYYFTFRPLAQSWMVGQAQLYTDATRGFFHPPWTMWFIALFAALPYRVGWVALTIFSLAALAASTIVFSQPGRGRAWALAFALFNLHTFDLLFRGQISATEVGGVALGWFAYQRKNGWLLGIAFLLLMIEPPNTLPAAILLAWLAWRDLPRRSFWIGVAQPILVVVLSLVFHGWWPPLWLANLSAQPVQPFFLTTIWRMADQLGLPLIVPWIIVIGVLVITVTAWRRASRLTVNDMDLARLMLVITATLMITPYSLSYRLVPLTAIVMPYLSRQRLSVLFGLYVLTFMPLLRLWVGRDNSWIDLGFVVAAFAAMIVPLIDSLNSFDKNAPALRT